MDFWKVWFLLEKIEFWWLIYLYCIELDKKNLIEGVKTNTKGDAKSIEDSYDDQIPNELKDHSLSNSKVIFGNRDSIIHTSSCQQK